MLKKLALYFGLAVSLNMNAFALVGGPWDGGDYSLILDDVGIYQASFRFKNGSGFAQWGNNVDLGPSTSSSASAGGTSASTSSSVGSVLNRSLIYHKGIQYFGNATGIADFEGKRISGMTNGQSEVTLSNQTSTSSSGSFFLFGTSNQISASTTAVNNGGRGFVANTNWSAKITKTSPIMRFKGTGQITFLGPDATPVISEIAQDILDGVNSNLAPQQVPIPTTYIESSTAVATAVTTSVGPPPSTTTTTTTTTTNNTYARPPADIIADQRALLEFGADITGIILENQLSNLERIRSYLSNSPDSDQGAVVEKLSVTGTRRFFLSQR